MNTELKNKLRTYASFTAGATLVATNLDAQIVHTNVNHNVGLNETYNLDIDNNGMPELECSSSYIKTSSSFAIRWRNFLSMRPYGYGYYSKIAGGFYPIPIPVGVEIGSSMPGYFFNGSGNGILGAYRFTFFPYYGTYYKSTYMSYYGFLDGTDKYVGVEFDISGQTHYGWVRISIQTSIDLTTKTYTGDYYVIDMAYESTPNTTIKAGEMFLAPPPAINLNALVNGGNIDFTFDASTSEEAVNDYRLFVVKEGTTFGLTEAETNSNYVSITPDGSANYAHTFTTGTVDSDGNTVLRTSPILDVSGEPLAANQNYNIYVLNMAKTPYATENSLSTPSNTFTITTVSLNEKSKNVNAFYSNGRLNINIDNTLVGADIKLYNTLGQVVLSEKLNNFSNSFQLNQSEGMYIITIQKDDTLISKKILVK
ncbi:MAG: T9SS type A sorting domain-containing protein [Bacteroidia bacterium]